VRQPEDRWNSPGVQRVLEAIGLWLAGFVPGSARKREGGGGISLVSGLVLLNRFWRRCVTTPVQESGGRALRHIMSSFSHGSSSSPLRCVRVVGLRWSSGAEQHRLVHVVKLPGVGDGGEEGGAWSDAPSVEGCPPSTVTGVIVFH
jgi:hypothetical protein